MSNKDGGTFLLCCFSANLLRISRYLSFYCECECCFCHVISLLSVFVFVCLTTLHLLLYTIETDNATLIFKKKYRNLYKNKHQVLPGFDISIGKKVRILNKKKPFLASLLAVIN